METDSPVELSAEQREEEGKEEEKPEVDEEKAETKPCEDPPAPLCESGTKEEPESAKLAPKVEEAAPGGAAKSNRQLFPSPTDWTNLLSVQVAFGLTTCASFMCSFYDSDQGLLVYKEDEDTCKVWFDGNEDNREDDLIWKLVRWFVGIAVVWSALLWLIFLVDAFSFGMVDACFPYFGRFLVELVMSIHFMCFLFLLSFTTQSSNLCWEQDCTLEDAAFILLAGTLAWWLAGAIVLSSRYALPIVYVGEEINELRETTEPRFSMWKTWRNVYLTGILVSILLAWVAYGVVLELKRRSAS
uniref:Uncharacterized protein n=1 Tax=Amphora coffeiformis TaxID=265554 RepID=A0A7S3L5B6_9STRA|eukprot:scaffold7918_cov165-Amphora_coffeaeformis.AAC.12